MLVHLLLYMEDGMRNTLVLVWVVRMGSDGVELRFQGRGGCMNQNLDLHWAEEESWGVFVGGQDSVVLDVEVEDVAGLDAQDAEAINRPSQLLPIT